MLRRLRIYFVGFGLGLIMTYVIFSKSEDRNLDIWTPEQRVLEDIRNDSVFLEAPKLRCYLNCLDVTSDELAALWTEGSVKSLRPGGDPYLYQIQFATDDRHLEATVSWDKVARELKSFRDLRNPKDCACNE